MLWYCNARHATFTPLSGAQAYFKQYLDILRSYSENVDTILENEDEINNIFNKNCFVEFYE